MKFFNIDYHASVIADVNHIFTNLGHTVDDWSLSGHSWVMNKPKADIKLRDGTSFTGSCTQETCDIFYETYKDQLSHYDGFISCYPVEFAMLYEKWDKPIIVVNCIRYEHGNTRNTPVWDRLNDFLKRWNEKGKLFYVCNNKGDQWYTEYYTGIKGTWIPNLCEYTKCLSTQEIKRVIYSERSQVEGLDGLPVASISSLKNSAWKFEWSELFKHCGMIHIPYHNGSMSIFEHYTGNLPMFIPSKTFGKKLFYSDRMFSDLTFYKIYGLQEPSDDMNPNKLSNPSIVDKWFDTCDFYDEENMPHIIYFDSFEHLRSLVTDWSLMRMTSEKMAAYNASYRKPMVYEKWNLILNKIRLFTIDL